MITLTRSRARQIRTVFSRCLNLSSRGPLPTVTLCAGGGGLFLRAKSHDAAIEFHQSGEFPEEQLSVYVSARQYGSLPAEKTYVDMLERLLGICTDLVDNYVTDSVLQPLARTIALK